jgi:hypothetical protein
MNSRTSFFSTTVAGNTRETIVWFHGSFAVLFLSLFSRQTSNPEWEPQMGSEMGQRQTETTYPSEAAYLKSVLLWLQEYWTGPVPRFYPYKRDAQGPRHYSTRRMHAAINRRNEIFDLPAFLPPRTSSQYRQRKAITVEGWQRW